MSGRRDGGVHDDLGAAVDRALLRRGPDPALRRTRHAPTIVEMTELNNVAQSNYDRFNTATRSPSTGRRPSSRSAIRTTSRRGSGSSASRPTPVPHLRRTTWLQLKLSGEARQVSVIVEFAPGSQVGARADDVRPQAAELRSLEQYPNDVGLHAYAEIRGTIRGTHSSCSAGPGSGRQPHRTSSTGSEQGDVVFRTVVTEQQQCAGREQTRWSPCPARAITPQDYLAVPGRVKDGAA